MNLGQEGINGMVKYACPKCPCESKKAGVCPQCNTALTARCWACGNQIVSEQIHLDEQVKSRFKPLGGIDSASIQTYR